MMDVARLAQVAARGLAEAGTEVLFGLPGGGSNLEIIGAAEAAGLKFVLTHGESAAAIMAGVYGELTGNPGASPGVTLPARARFWSMRIIPSTA